jgi:hypothetical protein
MRTVLARSGALRWPGLEDAARVDRDVAAVQAWAWRLGRLFGFFRFARSGWCAHQGDRLGLADVRLDGEGNRIPVINETDKLPGDAHGMAALGHGKDADRVDRFLRNREIPGGMGSIEHVDWSQHPSSRPWKEAFERLLTDPSAPLPE